MAAKCISKKVAKILFAIGAALFVASLAVLLIFPTIYKSQLRKDIALGEGTLMTKIWEDIPLPLYEKVYFFNITNGDDFVNKGVPLNVTEVGPYVFQGHWQKNYTQWNPNNTLSYLELRTYQFVEEMSVGSQDDEIYTLNAPMVIASDMLKQFNLPIRISASFLFTAFGEKVITKKKVRELAYEGYKDKIIVWAPAIKPDIPYKNGVFSWLYGMNASNDGLFTVFTGEDDPTKTDIIDKFNGEDKLNFWKGDSCNLINGTSIETGPPLPDNPESYTFFQTIFCRSLTFNYTGDEKRFGVTTKRFESTHDIFANGTDNPANACFDLKEGRPSGVLDISPCQFGAPAFISFPHFHLADPSYLQAINGLSPNGAEHGSHIEVEPNTGLSVDIKMRFQINLEVTHTEGVVQMDDVREGIYPILWVGLEMSLDEYWANYLLGQLNNPKIITYSVLGVACFISVILIVVSHVVLRAYSMEEDDNPLVGVKEDHKQNLKSRHLSTEYVATDKPPRHEQRQRSSTTHQSSGEIINQGSRIHHRTINADEQSEDEAAPILSVNSNQN